MLNRQRHWICALQIADRRRELGLTQQDVVERLATLGVTATNRTLSAIEHGQGVDVGRLPELAAALDCSVTYLLGLTTHPNHWVPDDGTVPAPVETAAHRTFAGDQSGWMQYTPGQESHAASVLEHGSWHHGVWHHPLGHIHPEEELAPAAGSGAPRRPAATVTVRANAGLQRFAAAGVVPESEEKRSARERTPITRTQARRA